MLTESGTLGEHVSYTCNALCRYSVAIMMDTEGSEVHLNELPQPQKAEACI